MNKDLSLDEPLAQYFKSTSKTVGTCSNNVSCDLMYDTDWSYRLRVEIPCEEADKKDPCFATNACICNNGYYSVSDAMPEVNLATYSGDTQTVQLFLTDKEE